MPAAAAAWDGLAAELHLTAASYASVIAGLTTGPWSGPAAASMAAAAAPLGGTAERQRRAGRGGGEPGQSGRCFLPAGLRGDGALHTDDIVSGWAGEQPWPLSGDQPPTDFKAIITGPIEPAATSSAALQPAAGLGEANTVGALTVPPTWTIATPAVQPIAVTLPALPATAVGAAVAEAAGEAAEVGSGSTLGEMAAAGLAGRAVAGTLAGGAGKSGGAATAGGRVRAGAPGTSEGAAPVAGDATSHDKPRSVVTGVAAELREFAKLRDEGILTDEEYTEQKNRLLAL